MPRIALVTCSEYPNLHDDDRAMLPALARVGLTAEPVSWDAPIDWSSYDLVVLRSTWDYVGRLAEFERWLDTLERSGVRVMNPLPTLRWNLRKTYLRELAEHGAPVVETHWISKGSTESLERVLDLHGWSEAVVKPAISAGGHDTHRVGRAKAGALQPIVEALAQRGEVMVQPFIGEIVERGEQSLLYFNRFFSHAIEKRPAAGEFRVQFTFGGTAAPISPDKKMCEVAERVLQQVPGPLLYARVDLVRTGDQVLVNEIELLEPMLYFLYAPEAAQRFAEALKGQLR
jgi:glutathione synthase/RimK-type ligase-like ATP-grasp enzyme